jgi:hypothetical protein
MIFIIMKWIKLLVNLPINPPDVLPNNSINNFSGNKTLIKLQKYFNKPLYKDIF